MKTMLSIVFVFISLNIATVIAQPRTDFSLKVGKLVIPLKIVKGPTNYYKGRIEVFKDDVIENLKEEISKLNKDKPFYGDKILIYFASHNQQPGTNVISCQLDMKEHTKIPADILTSIIEKLEPKDNISFQSLGSNDTVAMSNVIIYIKDPNQTYRPPKFPSFSTDKGVYSFQLVGGLKKNLLKVDSTVESNKKLVAIYSDKKKFDLMHIPGYRTKNRYIKITDSFWPEDEIEKKVSFSKQDLKPYYPYPEFALENEASSILKWGKMSASPISSSNSVESFNANINLPLEISIPNTKLNIVQFEMIVVPDIGVTTKYVCDNISQPEVQEVLKLVENHTTVYFQNFMVKDDAGKLLYFPMVYAFLVSAK